MYLDRHRTIHIFLFILTTLLFTACGSIDPPPVLQTVVVTVEGDSVIQLVTATPPPSPPPSPTQEPPERSLVVCLGEEPDSLYLYGTNATVSRSVLQTVYDGPLDQRAYTFHPVILEKVPSLADDDAAIQAVDVSLGETVVDADGTLTTLGVGTKVRPSGCFDQDCTLAYDGESALAMDQIAVTFRIIPDLTWSDGAPLSAQDSVYSFNLAAAPETLISKFKVERTANYQALDDLTLLWVGVPGFFDPTYFANFWTPLPTHAWERFSPAELPTVEVAVRSPLGYGPYVVEDWVPGDHIRLRANELYFRADEGLPVLDNLIFRFVGQDTNANLAQLVSGECDILDRSTHLDDQGALLLELESRGQINFDITTTLDWEHAAFGIQPVSYDDGYNPLVDRPDYFGDPRTRQAIALCMDRQMVVDEVLFGESTVLDTYLPPTHPLFNVNASQFPFDVEAGTALLQEVGWIDHDENPETPRKSQGILNVPDGTPFEFTYLTTQADQRARAAEILVASLAQCGIKAEIESLPTGDFYDNGPEGPLFGRVFEMAQFAWRIEVEPACYLYLGGAVPGDPLLEDDVGDRKYVFGWGGWNLTGYANPEYDAACVGARAFLPGQDAYVENHKRTQAIFASDLPVVPLYLHIAMAATRPDLCFFVMDSTADSDLWNIEAIDYGSSCE